MPNFYQKLVCITRHAIQFHQRPGWNTEHTNCLLMWQLHHFCFEVTREGLRPGWNCRHGKLFTQRPGWNKRILGKIYCVLNKSPVTFIKDERVMPGPYDTEFSDRLFVVLVRLAKTIYCFMKSIVQTLTTLPLLRQGSATALNKM